MSRDAELLTLMARVLSSLGGSLVRAVMARDVRMAAAGTALRLDIEGWLWLLDSPWWRTRSRNWPSRLLEPPRISARRSLAIQQSSDSAVSAIQEICRIIQRISDIQGAIASSVEQQTAASGEIGRSVTQAAAGGVEIADSIIGVADMASSTMNRVLELRDSSEELGRMSAQIDELLAPFQVTVPAGGPTRGRPSGGQRGECKGAEIAPAYQVDTVGRHSRS